MIANVVIFSDPHCGSQYGLCPPGRIRLDGGKNYYQSSVQAKIWKKWEEFWVRWVPQACKHEKFSVVCVGDAIDGVPHNSKEQISPNVSDQIEIAYRAISPIVDMCGGRYYHIRGTEAHVGKSAEFEEILANRLGAAKDTTGASSRAELFYEIRRGKRSALCHFTHHIGSAGRTAYETSAVMAELSELFTESGRWGSRMPDVIVRGHRHRNIGIRIPTKNGYGIAFTLAGWQAKTHYCYRIAGARTSTPQIGGSLIRIGDTDLFDRHAIWDLGRPPIVIAR